MVQRTHERHGHIDIIVNNAGMMIVKFFMELSGPCGLHIVADPKAQLLEQGRKLRQQPPGERGWCESTDLERNHDQGLIFGQARFVRKRLKSTNLIKELPADRSSKKGGSDD